MSLKDLLAGNWLFTRSKWVHLQITRNDDVVVVYLNGQKISRKEGGVTELFRYLRDLRLIVCPRYMPGAANRRKHLKATLDAITSTDSSENMKVNSAGNVYTQPSTVPECYTGKDAKLGGIPGQK